MIQICNSNRDSKFNPNINTVKDNREHLKRMKPGNGKTAQKLRELFALAEAPGLFPRTHRVTHLCNYRSRA